MKNLFSILLSLTPLLINAQAFSTGALGEKQSAMGGAGTGLALDAASMAFNPASISFIEGNSVNIGASAAVANTAYLDGNNNSLSRSKNDIGTPFHAYWAFELKDSVAAKWSKFKFGIGINTPYGGDSRWENDWTGKYSIIDKKLASIAFAPGVSYKINEKLSIGVSAGYSQSFLHVENAIPVSPDANVVMDFKSQGWGFGAGIYYQHNDYLSFGLGYISKTHNKSYQGKATFHVPALIADQFPSGEVHTESTVPQGISFGIGYDVDDKLIILADVNYGFWEVFDSTIFEFSNASPTSAVTSIRIPNNYTNTYSLRFGAMYKINDKIIPRIGMSFEQTPVPKEYLYPETPDGNRINLTAGGSYVFNRHISIDLSYRFVNVAKRTSTNLYSNMKGTYKTYAHVTGLSLNYKF